MPTQTGSIDLKGSKSSFDSSIQSLDDAILLRVTAEEELAGRLTTAEAGLSLKIDSVEGVSGTDLISNINAVADRITLSANQINFTNNTTVASELSALNSAISIDTTAPSVRIGNPENFYILITDTEMGFYQRGVVVPIAYMNGSELYVKNSLSFGRFVFTQRDNNHFTLKLID